MEKGEFSALEMCHFFDIWIESSWLNQERVHHYPAVSFRHSLPAQLFHQSREDAAAVALISQSVEHDETDGIQF